MLLAPASGRAETSRCGYVERGASNLRSARAPGKSRWVASVATPDELAIRSASHPHYDPSHASRRHLFALPPAGPSGARHARLEAVSAAGFASVVLDVDSTLCGVEGIDWLAARRGAEAGALIAKLLSDPATLKALTSAPTYWISVTGFLFARPMSARSGSRSRRW